MFLFLLNLLIQYSFPKQVKTQLIICLNISVTMMMTPSLEAAVSTLYHLGNTEQLHLI